jgi:glycosyltransferase involved in cell wall biosynthesis
VGTFESFSVRRFDGVVCATPRIAQTLATPHTIEALNYPVAEEITVPDSEVERDPAKVVFVGGFTAIRGAAEMIDAMTLLNQRLPARLVICGTMPSDVRARSEGQPGWAYVEDMGWQTRPQTQHQMATATCGLCVFHPEPNHVEAVPNKLFEYMAAGLPVVASNFPFWHHFVADVGAGVMVDPLDPESIAAGLQQILDDPGRAANMGAAGRQAVRDRFNWDIEAGKLLILVSSVLASSAPGKQRQSPQA